MKSFDSLTFNIKGNIPEEWQRSSTSFIYFNVTKSSIIIIKHNLNQAQKKVSLSECILQNKTVCNLKES